MDSLLEFFDLQKDSDDLRLLIVVEEAHLWTLREVGNDAIRFLDKAARMLRKKGVGVMLVSHKISDFDPAMRSSMNVSARAKTDSTTPKPIDIGGYFELERGETTEDLRREIADAAETFGIKIEVAHHEVAVGQNEIDFEYGEAVATADQTVTMKMVTKAIAARGGYMATYMPKPFMNVNGSGMHVHESMWSTDGKTNVFFENNESHNYLSDKALHFIGGQLTHGREMCAVLASWPNSYKRLVPGFEAPVYIAWAFKNRSPLIRVPNFSARSGAARCEIRCPDPAGNPYLQFAVLCLSGLDGIRKKIDPPEPTEMNVYHMSYEERKERGIVSLPESLYEALGETEKSEFMKQALGEESFNAFLKEKHKEWDLYRTQVSSWEFERYVKKL